MNPADFDDPDFDLEVDVDEDCCACICPEEDEPATAVVHEGVRYEAPPSMSGVLLEERALQAQQTKPTPTVAGQMKKVLDGAALESPESTEMEKVLLAAGFEPADIAANLESLRLRYALNDLVKAQQMQMVMRVTQGVHLEEALDLEGLRSALLQSGFAPQLIDGALAELSSAQQSAFGVLSPPSGGYVVARDAASGRLLWHQRVFADAHVTITRLEMRQGNLWLQDSLYREYRLDLKTREVAEIPSIGAEVKRLLRGRNPVDATRINPHQFLPDKSDLAAWTRVAELLQAHPVTCLSLGQQLTLCLHARAWPQVWGLALTLQELAHPSSSEPMPWLVQAVEQAQAGGATHPDRSHEEPARTALRSQEGLRGLLLTLYGGLSPRERHLEPAAGEALTQLLSQLDALSAESAVLACAHNLGESLKVATGSPRERIGRLRAWVVKLACLLGQG